MLKATPLSTDELFQKLVRSYGKLVIVKTSSRTVAGVVSSVELFGDHASPSIAISFADGAKRVVLEDYVLQNKAELQVVDRDEFLPTPIYTHLSA